jgi:hypothetical protein
MLTRKQLDAWNNAVSPVSFIFLPEIKGLQFYTSTGILRAAHYLMMCGRHDREIERIFGPNFMETVRLERPRRTAVDIMYRDTYRERKMLGEFAK